MCGAAAPGDQGTPKIFGPPPPRLNRLRMRTGVPCQLCLQERSNFGTAAKHRLVPPFADIELSQRLRPDGPQNRTRQPIHVSARAGCHRPRLACSDEPRSKGPMPLLRLLCAFGAPDRGAPNSLLSSLRLDGLLNLLLDGLQVEACTLLHGRELDRGLGDLCHLLLHELEAPELVDEPVVIAD